MLAFFFPNRKTVIDEKNKTFTITSYRWLFVPSYRQIAFADVKNVTDTLTWSYDGYNKEYNFYSAVCLHTGSQQKIIIGEIEADTKKGTAVHQPEMQVSAEKTAPGRNAALAIREILNRSMTQSNR